MTDPPFTGEEVTACLKVLRTLADRPEQCDGGDPRLAAVRDHAARLLRAGRDGRKRDDRRRDHELLDGARIRGASEAPDRPSAPAALCKPRRCYVCKRPYTTVHAFYGCLCQECGDFNYAKRMQTADLLGTTALVTGGRIKIGFQTTLKLLRAGASVEITTRFPHDAARRYLHEADFPQWRGRLRIHELDLRDLPGVERFAARLMQRLSHLDIVVNNAAQTIRRPAAFYRHLLEGEPLPDAARGLLGEPAAPTGEASPWAIRRRPGEDGLCEYFPPGRFDADGQQVDLRPSNSWLLELGGVEPIELLEVHAVNCLAPFLLLRRLEAVLLGHPQTPKYVVNVSAMEGQLNAAYKTGRHPHTNMAKAALNMLTRTCAGPYARRGVYMNSVDTGWITNEAPRPAADRMAAEGFREPLDATDGAARVLDPVFVGRNTGRHEFGQFWKDYRPVPW